MCWVVGKVNGGGWMSGTLVKSDDQVIRNGYLLLQIKKKTYTAGLTSEWYWDGLFMRPLCVLLLIPWWPGCGCAMSLFRWEIGCHKVSLKVS
jgi:hypothetical protein